MINVYSIIEQSPQLWPIKLRCDEPIEQDWWRLDVMPPSAFEEAEHVLNAIDDDYSHQSADLCADIAKVESGIWAFCEKAWDWIPGLESSGCRIAHKVRVSKGTKNYKLVYCAPVLDLLDHKTADFSWNDGLISWVRGCHFYEWDGVPPLMFQVLFHNKKEYRGVKASPSMRCFVSQDFSDELDKRMLTGVNLVPVPRTKRPVQISEPKNVIVYSP